MAGFLNSLKQMMIGQPEQTRQFPRFNQGQEGVLDQFLQQGSQNADFGNIEKQARQQFSQQTVPGLAERFTSMGAGSQGSSAFQGALGQAGAGLETGLGALRSQFGMQQAKMGLQPRFDSTFSEATPGYLQKNLEGLFEQGPEMILKLLPLLMGL